MSLALNSDQPVLITGATGFLGGALARRLLDEGVNVRLLVRSAERAKPLADLGATLIIGDLNDPSAVREAVEGCTYVFHVAAALRGDYATHYRANVEGTRTLMTAAADAAVRRVVHVSSIAVYGNNYPGSVLENMPLLPGADPYARTKRDAEDVVRELGSQRGLPYSIIRPGMIYGAGAGLWTGTLFQIAKRNPTPFIGDGSGNAHFIFVEDVVDLMMTLAEHPRADGEAFNCTPDAPPTWREYIQAYSRLAGHQNWLALPVPLFRVIAGIAMLVAPRDTIARDLPDLLNFFLSHSAFRMSKARNLLGWSPHFSIEAGIAECVPWLREKGWLE